MEYFSDEDAEYFQYLYDLQGYMVIKDVLTKQQVAEINSLIDEKIPPLPENWEEVAAEKHAYSIYRFGMAGGSYPSGPGFLDWGQPLVDLIDHPLIMDIMRMQLGDAFRLDRIFGMRMQKGMPNGKLHSDYGASEPFTYAERGKYYPQPGFQALHGFGVAVLNLTDSGPDTGGLRVIPGSHNSHFRLPNRIREETNTEMVICPEAPAGSMVFFSEATTHGTGAWTADHERRSLLYKYCASQLTWSRTRVTAPAGATLTSRQQLLLEEPAGAKWFFPSVFD
ncbi:MAG: hypothetical protein CMQ33_02095 [Gammaproteobacteria bacterium]|nr:hypothetical protein [Gammaproteobacteria bacterium]